MADEEKESSEITESTQDIFAEAENMNDGKSNLMGGLPPEDEEKTPVDKPRPISSEQETDVATDDDTEDSETDGEDEENTESEEESTEIEQEEIEEDDDKDDDDKSDLKEEPNDPQGSEEVRSKLSEAFPDKNFESFDDVANTLIGERQANEKVYDLFGESEEMVQIARAMDGNDFSFMEALAATVDIPEALDEMKEEDPEQYKKVMKAQARREVELEQQEKERDQMEETFRENQEKSQENIASFQEEHDMDDSEAEEFITKVGDHFSEIVQGNVTPAFMKIMRRGMNYETDIEQAKEAGRIEGRNEKIEKEKKKKLGDKLPNITGKGKPTKNKTKKESDIFDDALTPQTPISEID